MKENKKKIFILGVGAQKCGTTWLHSQLIKSNCINLGLVKEHHVFDAIYSEISEQFTRPPNLISAQRYIRNNIFKNTFNLNELIYPLIKKFFIKYPDFYFKYFYMVSQNKNIKAVGDITPSYSTLSSQAYYEIKKNLELYGFEVKVIFLMRDPIERVWSMLRMNRRNILRNDPKYKFKNTENEELREFYISKTAKIRTQYQNTINNLELVFDQNNIYYGFYETLFTEQEFCKIENFLQLNLPNPDFDLRLNPSEKNIHVDEKLRKEIAHHYIETYDTVKNIFGKKMLEIWGGYKYFD